MKIEQRDKALKISELRKKHHVTYAELESVFGWPKSSFYNVESRAHSKDWKTIPSAFSIKRLNQVLDYLQMSNGEKAVPNMCWNCNHMFTGCNWSDRGEPVPGWVAEPTAKSFVESYSIILCPEFEFQKKYRYEALLTDDEPAVRLLTAVINQFKKEFIADVRAQNNAEQINECIERHKPDFEGMFGERWQTALAHWMRMAASNKTITEIIQGHKPQSHHKLKREEY